jgi:hypothetical protein
MHPLLPSVHIENTQIINRTTEALEELLMGSIWPTGYNYITNGLENIYFDFISFALV